MNTQQPNELNQVRDIIWEIEDKSASGDYIFRGEPECYPKVSSTLYRQYRKILGDDFDVEVVQTNMLREGKEYLPGPVGDFELLTELQHYGGKTNLIDFTTDSRVALFFACDGSPGKKGRVILRKRGDIEDLVENPREPSKPLNRVIAQKSIFVRPRRGFVEFDQDKDVVEIPAALKKPMLEYLHKYHNISAKTIYNDLHGFIRTQDIHHKAYEEFYRGFSAEAKGDLDKAIRYYDKAIQLKPDLHAAYYNRGNAYFQKGEVDNAIKNFTTAIELKPDYTDAYYNRGTTYLRKGELDNAIKDLTTAIELKPDFFGAYNNRGFAHRKKDEFDKAIQNYDKAIRLNPDSADAYCNRGEAWMHLREWDKAKADLTLAKNMGYNIIDLFQNDYENVAAFEKKNGIAVPADIKEMLTPA